jgi:hypothetical protein
MKSWKFTVEGGSAFPMDMLRYDACYPTDGDSVSAMQEILGVRKVTLRSHIQPPTDGRWRSFGWYVRDTEIFG